MRDQQSRWRRKARLLERHGNPRAKIAWGRASRTFWSIHRFLTEPPPTEGIPPIMAEELRATGLL